MKVERISEYLTTFVVLIVAFGMALFLGGLSGQGNFRNVTIVIAVFVVAILGIKMKTNIWFFIPLTMGLTGSLRFLPLPFSVNEVGILLAFGWFVIFQAFKVIRTKPAIGYLDILLFANLLILALAFARNPVGVSSIDADRVGGRPYFSTAIAVMGYWVLSHCILSAKAARVLPIYTLIGTGIGTILGMISYLIPASVPILSRFYTGITAETYFAQDADAPESSGVNRIGVLTSGGISGFNALCSWFRPITLINPLNIVRFVLFFIAIAMVFLSGFRSYLLQCAVFYMVASFYYGRMGDVMKNAILGFLLTAFLITGQGILFELPLNAQRALSFLPGNWSQAAIEDAKGSTDWRLEMWTEMWTEDRWVKNWWFGDGFGYSSRTLKEMNAATDTKSDRAGQENFLITGQVHSGPLSALRYVGYVGLALYLILCIAMARAAHRLILRAKGTPFFVPALFFGVSIIIAPAFFVFIVGGYDVNFPKTVISLGFLRLLQRGFDQYEKDQRPKETVFPTKSIDLRPPLLTH